MAELRQRVEALKSDNETLLRLKDLNYSEKLKELTEKYMMEIEALKKSTATLYQDRESNEKNYALELEQAKKNNQVELEEIERGFNLKMKDENEKYLELTENTTRIRKAWENQKNNMEVFHNTQVSQLTDLYQKKLQEKQDEMTSVSNANIIA